MDIKIKNFILKNLNETAKIIIGVLQKTDNREISDEVYKIHLDYVYKILALILEPHLSQEYILIKKDIDLFNSAEETNYKKLINIGDRVLQLGKNIIDNY